jgi:Protein of unknown function (DUF3108)
MSATQRRRNLCCIASCLAALLLNSAAARASQIVADYTAFWAGLPAADIRLRLGSERGGYNDEIEIRTTGLVRLFTHFRADAQAGGRLAAGGLAVPSQYDALYDIRKWRHRQIDMRFVAREGGVVAERGAKDTSEKALLAEDYRRGILDPLSALEAVRVAIAAGGAKPGTSFAIPVYDGTRRFDVVGHVLPKAEQTPGGVRAVLSLRPIAGFKGQSKVDGDPDDAPRPVSMILGSDRTLLPLLVSLRVFWLPLVIRLDHVCSGAAAACTGREPPA